MEGPLGEEPLLSGQNIIGILRTLNPGYIHSTRHEGFQRWAEIAQSSAKMAPSSANMPPS